MISKLIGHPGVFTAVLALCAVLLSGIAVSTHNHVEADPDYLPHEIEAAKESIALSLMGQLQLSIGDIMWLKSMEYLHGGMIQRMPTQAEEQQGYMPREDADAPAGLSHKNGVQMVLDRERDWRGLFGEIERHVRPYDTRHRHADPVELIPWYQMAVRLNPRLERLYTLGAFYLADFAQAPAEAHEMLVAGINANPDSFEIHGALGRLYFDYADRLHLLVHDHHGHDHGHDHGHGESPPLSTPKEAYAEAASLLARAVELAKGQRRAMAERREVFDDTQNQIFGESYLYLSRAYVAIGNHDKALAAAIDGYETATHYGQRNLLRVQQRSVQRAIDGKPDEPAPAGTGANAH